MSANFVNIHHACTVRLILLTFLCWSCYRQRMLYHPIARFNTSKRGMKNGHITLLFGDGNPLVLLESKRSRSRYFQAGVGAGVGVA